MNRLLRHILLAILLSLAVLSGCGDSEKVHTPVPDDPYAAARVGTDSTLEVMTWNLQNFPKLGNTTVDHVVAMIEGVDADVIALQEIESSSHFQRVVDNLEGWEGYRATSAGYDLNLAYLYRTDGPLEVTSIYEILAGQGRALPRSPLVLEGNINGIGYVIINNHFKCCGDGSIDEGDDWDEETRRQDACLLLEQYAADHYADRRVIIVGDLNDEITDPPSANVFQNFIDDSSQWQFTDMPIAQDSGTIWSYPSWPSHIDHILINGTTFADFSSEAATVEVVPLTDYIRGGWSTYNEEVSDHLPVVVRLEPQLGPNPFMGARIGTDNTLEVATWNLGNFGDGAEEANLAAMAIEALDADVVALQEVVSSAQFNALDDALPDWEGVLGTGSSAGINLAFLFRADGSLDNVSVAEIFPDNDVEFVRAPLVMAADFQGESFVVINIHHKCCGDGAISPTEPFDEENRRLNANLLLIDYINMQHSQDRVFLAGDFNDLLDDPLQDNVFLDFLVEPDLWDFVDMGIATGPAVGWSMPDLPAHVDHILVTDELFGAMSGESFAVEVSPLHEYLDGGWGEYSSLLSDHLPLVVRLGW